MNIFDGFVPSDNNFSSLNIDSFDLIGGQMWSESSTRIQESEFNHNGLLNCNSTDFPQQYQTDDDILRWVCDTGLESVLNDDLSNILTGNHTREGSLEDIFMAPLADNKNMASVVPNKGLFSQICSNRTGSSSLGKCSMSDGLSSRSCIAAQSERADESSKGTKKRGRRGESTRPRPKDRQMIQDRIKELREIIPNGAKCSIDSLLDRAIKHMLFMQGVMMYGDKLKQIDEFKVGQARRDNGNGGISSSSAAWAIDVGGQNPVVVEDLGHSGQMLIEMVCEEQGLFLEIADVIRSFGLTILKGVVEARGDKVWAHFIVETNRSVTRMQVLMSLLQLLNETSSSPLQFKTISDENEDRSSLLNNYHQQSMMLADTLR